MLRKAEEHLANQRAHEAETLSKLEAARYKRQQEKLRHEEEEASHLILSL